MSRFLMLPVLLLLATAPAAADDLATCRDGKAAPELRIASCTRVIAAGKIRGQDVAVIYFTRGSLYQSKNDYEHALADLNATIRLLPNSSDAYAARGIIYKSMGDYDRAIADLNEAIRLEPSSGRAYAERAECYEAKGNHDRAIADYSEAIRLVPNSAIIFVSRGDVYFSMGDLERALADFDEAIRLDPNFTVAYIERALINQRKGDYNRAIADSSEAIRLDPNSADSYGYYIVRGTSYGYQGDYDHAIADYNEVIRLDPKTTSYYVTRGMMYTQAGRYDRAIDDFSEANRRDPNNAEALFRRGRAYCLKGDFSNALVDFRKAAALEPGDTYAAAAVTRTEKKLAARSDLKPTTSPPVTNPDQTPRTSDARAERRIALVIGNSAYEKFGRLPNPSNDAEALAATLKQIGFAKVTLQLDLPHDKLVAALQAFSSDAVRADWALVYFAGHGLEIGGINYFIPVDAKLASDRDISSEAIELEEVIQVVSAAKKLGIVIVDACRNNPFVDAIVRSMASTRAIEHGLSPVDPDGATLVAYAAKHGQVALDGEGRNSPFLTAIVKNVDLPGIEIGLLFRKVRDDVLAMTARRQEPFVYGSLPSEALYFRQP